MTLSIFSVCSPSFGQISITNMHQLYFLYMQTMYPVISSLPERERAVHMQEIVCLTFIMKMNDLLTITSKISKLMNCLVLVRIKLKKPFPDC